MPKSANLHPNHLHPLRPRLIHGLFILLQRLVLALLQVHNWSWVVRALFLILLFAKSLPRRKDRLALDIAELGNPLTNIVAIGIVSLCLQDGTEECVIRLY